MISRDAWLAALDEAGEGLAAHDPDALTTVELSKLWGCHVEMARTKLLALVEAGLAIRVRKHNGYRYVAAYVLTKKGKK